MAETVRVICRARPLNTREKKLGCKDVLKIDNAVGQVRVRTQTGHYGRKSKKTQTK